MKTKVRSLLKKALKKMGISFPLGKIPVSWPKEKYGDYASSLPLILAKEFRKDPQRIGKEILKNIEEKRRKRFFKEIEITDDGFINFFISKNYLLQSLGKILKEGENYPSFKEKKKRINLEFLSANPTGPLTIGNGRGGFLGDCLANCLEKLGYQVKREYYINDIGSQIEKLGSSILGKKFFYQGDYIRKLQKRVKGKDPLKVGKRGAQIILKEIIKPTLKKLKIKFDIFFPESRLYQKKEVEKVIKILKEKNLIYQKKGALWFRSKKFNDDKDRVLIRKNGQPTYFLSDIAYLKNKFSRGFDKLIYIWGADHFGYQKRIISAGKALGYSPLKIKIIIIQLVKLLKGKKEIKMSKRKGVFFTLADLIDEVGLDSARFFFLRKTAQTHLKFDLQLAKSASERNPLFKIQYAYARICSLLRKLKWEKPKTMFLSNLFDPLEIQLAKALIKFPEVLKEIDQNLQVSLLTDYSFKVASLFHQFYEKCPILKEKEEIKKARISLVWATKIILKNCFNLMGISLPLRM